MRLESGNPRRWTLSAGEVALGEEFEPFAHQDGRGSLDIIEVDGEKLATTRADQNRVAEVDIHLGHEQRS